MSKFLDHLDPRMWGHYLVSKRREPVTQWPGPTYRLTGTCAIPLRYAKTLSFIDWWNVRYLFCLKQRKPVRTGVSGDDGHSWRLATVPLTVSHRECAVATVRTAWSHRKLRVRFANACCHQSTQHYKVHPRTGHEGPDGGGGRGIAVLFL